MPGPAAGIRTISQPPGGKVTGTRTTSKADGTALNKAITRGGERQQATVSKLRLLLYPKPPPSLPPLLMARQGMTEEPVGVRTIRVLVGTTTMTTPLAAGMRTIRVLAGTTITIRLAAGARITMEVLGVADPNMIPRSSPNSTHLTGPGAVHLVHSLLQIIRPGLVATRAAMGTAGWGHLEIVETVAKITMESGTAAGLILVVPVANPRARSIGLEAWALHQTTALVRGTTTTTIGIARLPDHELTAVAASGHPSRDVGVALSQALLNGEITGRAHTTSTDTAFNNPGLLAITSTRTLQFPQ